jgi:hypothetical protein
MCGGAGIPCGGATPDETYSCATCDGEPSQPAQPAQVTQRRLEHEPLDEPGREHHVARLEVERPQCCQRAEREEPGIVGAGLQRQVALHREAARPLHRRLAQRPLQRLEPRRAVLLEQRARPLPLDGRQRGQQL